MQPQSAYLRESTRPRGRPAIHQHWGVLGSTTDTQRATTALKRGAVIAHGFGQFYVLTTRPNIETVRSMNLWKGRPSDQVGSLSTTPLMIPSLFDWSLLPSTLRREKILSLMDSLLALGPFGFRGPARTDIPHHLAALDRKVRTTQVIVPGYRCPSQALFASFLRKIPERFVYVTSANKSHHATGNAEEPAHWKIRPLAEDFRHVDELCVLAHQDEALARRRHPDHLPMSTSILSFHRRSGSGLPTLYLERQGSLSIERIAQLVTDHGCHLEMSPTGEHRIPARSYSANTFN